MAKVYKKPELSNWFCSHECEIGKKYVPEITEKSLSEIVLETLALINKLEREKDRLIEIRDGLICVQGDRSVAQAFDMARCGFRMLAEMEPEHVVCADKYL